MRISHAAALVNSSAHRTSGLERSLTDPPHRQPADMVVASSNLLTSVTGHDEVERRKCWLAWLGRIIMTLLRASAEARW
jgi:hypothetical protein